MESGSARSVKEEAVGLPSLSVSGVDSRDKTLPLVWVFRPMEKRGTFGNNSIWVGNRHRKLWAIPQCEGQCLGVLRVLWSQKSLVPKPNNVEATTQMVNPDTVLPVLEALGLPSELLEEVKKRLPLVKLPEKKKERALADLRDKLDKEKKGKIGEPR